MFLGKRKKPKETTVDSLIGQHTQILGNINFGGGLHVDGTIKGNVFAGDHDTSMLTLSDRGTIEGEVRVPYARINGLIVGDVYVQQHVELLPNARIEGNVYYTLMEMAMGAEVNGKLVRTADSDKQPLALSHRDTIDIPE